MILVKKRLTSLSLSTEFSVSSLEKEVNGRFLLHAIQLSPLSSYKEHEYSQFFSLTPLGEKTLSFAVKVTTIFYVLVEVNIYTRSDM